MTDDWLSFVLADWLVIRGEKQISNTVEACCPAIAGAAQLRLRCCDAQSR